jgi:hypothetical protein
VIEFRLAYELGLTLALVPYLLATPILEYVAGRSIWRASQIQQRYTVYQIGRHNRSFLRNYADDLIRLGLAFAVAAAIIALSLRAAGRAGLIDPLDPLADRAVMEGVYAAGAVGYGLLAWALMNCLFLFGMARHWLVVRALAAGLGVNVLVGLVASRAWGYPYSAVGLVAGALVFGVVTGRAALRGLRKMDYYGYAAY